MNEETAGSAPLERRVRPHPDEMPHGWYWVRFDRGGDLTDPQPALWDGNHWRGVGWSGQSLHDVLDMERCEWPVGDPLQGAADWLCKACDEPDIAMLQRQLLIGYNRAARLFTRAMASAA